MPVCDCGYLQEAPSKRLAYRLTQDSPFVCRESMYFYCGENPYKNVVFCGEGLTQVNTVVRAVRHGDVGMVGWVGSSCNNSHVDGHHKVTSMFFVAKAVLG